MYPDKSYIPKLDFIISTSYSLFVSVHFMILYSSNRMILQYLITEYRMLIIIYLYFSKHYYYSVQVTSYRTY